MRRIVTRTGLAPWGTSLASTWTWLALVASFALTPAAGGAQTSGALSPRAARQAAFGEALARIGRSGLRGLLSASGSLGDLRNRAGSYRTAVGLERARAAPLEGRIAALESALQDPGLPAPDRSVLAGLLRDARAELEEVPRYDAAYSAATVQGEALLPLTLVGDRPLFLMIRGRGHARWGGDDGLTVFSEGASVGPVLVAGDRWILSPGLTLGRTDVDIGPFDGNSGATSVGSRLDVGAILGGGWSAALQLGHAWSREASTIVRPGPTGGTEVRTEGWSTTTSAKAELRGRFPAVELSGVPVSFGPRIGAFMTSTHAPPVTNSLGETGTGPFGNRETLSAVRAGAVLDTDLGAWSPSLYLGWEHELGSEMSSLVDDPAALLGAVGVSWSWARGRRLVLDGSAVRGLRGRRAVSELTLVLILDG